MNFNRKDVVIGLIIIALIVVGVLFYKKQKITKILPTPTPQTISFKEELENNFKFDIPDDVTTIELKDVNGKDARGIATITEILADIEDPASGYFYQAWLENDLPAQAGGKLISLGKMQMAKGGWLLEYDGSRYPEYTKIVISLEKSFDSNLEKRILEGSF